MSTSSNETKHTTKAAVYELVDALRSCDPDKLKAALHRTFTPDAKIQLGHPFGKLTGPKELWETVYEPLTKAMPQFERRDFIMISGPRWGAPNAEEWVGIGGNFLGTLTSSWLGIPPGTHPVYMRFHEYFKVEDGKVAEMQGLWDIPQVMLQRQIWPMGRSLGYECMCPGPANGVGIYSGERNENVSEASLQTVWDMLLGVQKGTSRNPERGLSGFWHEQANWHGPAGIGSARGQKDIAQHIFKQFRDGLSNNTRHLREGVFFAENELVGFTGWPSGTANHTGPGFLGMPATERIITRSSLDFWRIENGAVRECWVMVDILDIYKQIGVDVMARMDQLLS